MPKVMSHYTELARRHDRAQGFARPDEIVAAVPATRPPDPVDVAWGVAGGAGAVFFSLFAVLAAGIATAGQYWRRKHKANNSEAPSVNVMIIVRRSSVDVAEVKRFGRRIGKTLGTYDFSQVRYWRTDFAVDTRMQTGGVEWTVHGWFERDLRAALRPLGITLDQLPAAIPYKEPSE